MAVVLIVIAAISIFFSRMGSLLDYHWQWEVIPNYFMFKDPITGAFRANMLLIGFMTTIRLSVWATVLGFLLGTLSGIMGAKGSFSQRFVSQLYVETIRNIPSLVLVILFY